MRVKSIVLGGWYQRTTLHLSEIHNLLANGTSHLPLSESKLKDFQKNLDLTAVARNASYFEYIQAETRSGITLKFYEDGLYTLTKDSGEIKETSEELLKFFNDYLNPALNYIFSLGAPTPKVLANIKETLPIAITVIDKEPDKLADKLELSTVYSQISAQDVTVYKTADKIVVASDKEMPELESLVENQIFFREFKDQLERYLNIHRQIWEEISDIKERPAVRGKQIERLRDQLDGYQKTINLIESRINQMSSYVKTRATITKEQKIESYLNQLFQYKFETLIDTHSYIKEIWRMTKDYLNTALSTINNLQGESTKETISSLRLITTIGVVAGIFGYLSKTSLPEVTLMGLVYFVLLLILTWLINKSVGMIYSNLKYRIKFIESRKL